MPALTDARPGTELRSLEIALTPQQSIAVDAKQPAMIRLSQKFEFSAARRLHNPSYSEADNVATFGKCNNPAGDGHNYLVQVTVSGKPDAGGHGPFVSNPGAAVGTGWYANPCS